MTQKSVYNIGRASNRTSKDIRAVTKEEVKRCMINEPYISVEGIVKKIHRDRSAISIYYHRFRRCGFE